MTYTRIALAAVFVAVGTAAAHADVVISTAATQNMSCSGGVCAPTATDAVLNITDLENLLASASITITTTGSGIQANDIDVDAALAWASSGTLALDAFGSIAIKKPVLIEGLSGLSLATNDGGKNGTLSFGRNGNVAFENLSSSLVINGVAYTLVSTLPTLASAITANPAGTYALASDYDASADGTYTLPPITVTFVGTFEGLGNSIINVKINDPDDEQFYYVGLFPELGVGGTIRDFGLKSAKVQVVEGSIANLGSLVGKNDGSIVNSFATGLVRTVDEVDQVGGLVAYNFGGNITGSYAACTVDAPGSGGRIGGLVGENIGTISSSFATRSVRGGSSSWIGGLVGDSAGTDGIINSYATANVSGKSQAVMGGLIGDEGATESHSYAKGHPQGRGLYEAARDSYSSGTLPTGRRLTGGSIGTNADVNNSNLYWDTTTSGTNIGVGRGSTKGVTGLTTQQLQSGLPTGFDPKIWAENPNINNGFPYLIGNPPPK